VTLVNIKDLATQLGKAEEEVTLPNGRQIRQIVWSGDDLPTLARLLHNRSAELDTVVNIDGPAPAWLVAAITHEVHPRAVRLNSPDGFVAVGVQRPSGNGVGENLKFSLTTNESGWVTLLCQQQDPSVPLDPEGLSGIVPPEVPIGSKVIISGRMPNWLTVSLAMAYHGLAKAVACYQPGVGATVAWTHSKEVRLGEIIN
jgi:CRISPR-associated Csx3 family protein